MELFTKIKVMMKVNGFTLARDLARLVFPCRAARLISNSNWFSCRWSWSWSRFKSLCTDLNSRWLFRNSSIVIKAMWDVVMHFSEAVRKRVITFGGRFGEKRLQWLHYVFDQSQEKRAKSWLTNLFRNRLVENLTPQRENHNDMTKNLSLNKENSGLWRLFTCGLRYLYTSSISIY